MKATGSFCICLAIPGGVSQVGSLPLHCPSALHMRVLLPFRTSPSLHEYAAWDPTSVPVSATRPSMGFKRVGQTTTVWKDTMFATVIAATSVVKTRN